MIGIDTNLLVYAHREATPQHQAAKKALEKASLHRRGWGLPLPVLAEFWCIVTHPSATGRPSTPSEARRFLQGLIEGGQAQIWKPRSDFGALLLKQAARLKISGGRIFDLQIGLIAVQNGGRELWTHDSRFLAPTGIQVVDPLR